MHHYTITILGTSLKILLTNLLYFFNPKMGIHHLNHKKVDHSVRVLLQFF